MILPMLSTGAAGGLMSSMAGSSLMSSLGSIGSGIGSFLNSNFGSGLTMGLGSLVGGLFSNASNASQASKNRRMIRWLAKNRYQLMVDDLRKAGINPIYAVQGGSAPAVTGGAIPHMSDVATPAIGTALNAMAALSKMRNDRMVAESQSNLNQATAANTAAKTMEQVARNEYTRPKLDAELKRTRGEVALIEADRQRRSLQNKVLQNSADSLLDPRWNKAAGYARDVMDLVGSVIFSASGAGRLIQTLQKVKSASKRMSSVPHGDDGSRNPLLVDTSLYW